MWLSNVGCSSDDEILDDCYFDGWGTNYCGHYEDVGVICRPGKLDIASGYGGNPPYSNFGNSNSIVSDNIPPVRDVTVTSVGSSSISIRWTVSCKVS